MLDDKAQIGLTPVASAALGELVEKGLFGSEGDGYKFSVAYALAAGLDPERAPQKGYVTKFNAAGGLDRDGSLREVVILLAASGRQRPYAMAEKLAEVGVKALHERIANSEALADILQELAEESSTRG